MLLALPVIPVASVEEKLVSVLRDLSKPAEQKKLSWDRVVKVKRVRVSREARMLPTALRKKRRTEKGPPRPWQWSRSYRAHTWARVALGICEALILAMSLGVLDHRDKDLQPGWPMVWYRLEVHPYGPRPDG